ncbi:insulin-like peptide INSL5 [Rhea pennata]|uniref:insulin-like peptide INSL5 n=1 Tax=Rhea pennata TaxID=8795 RepID=UPI002E2763E5
MRPAALVLALLSLLAAAGGEANPVKLCGRDFVRAVVFTCGGSRWRRHAADDGPPPDGENPLPFPRESAGPAGAPGHAGLPGHAARELARGGAAALGKREAARLLTASCCSVGCSERDISSLC